MRRSAWLKRGEVGPSGQDGWLPASYSTGQRMQPRTASSACKKEKNGECRQLVLVGTKRANEQRRFGSRGPRWTRRRRRLESHRSSRVIVWPSPLFSPPRPSPCPRCRALLPHPRTMQHRESGTARVVLQRCVARFPQLSNWRERGTSASDLSALGGASPLDLALLGRRRTPQLVLDAATPSHVGRALLAPPRQHPHPRKILR